MNNPVSDVAFTSAVKAQQTRLGSRTAYARMDEKGGWSDTVSEELAQFIGERDSFYLATTSALGQPYVQHRGGPKGFLKIVDERTLAFADFSGNRQYITAGNLSENDRAFIFLMDYANRRRIKIWGRARVIEDDTPLLARLIDPSYKGKPERAIEFRIEAWDVNCPQHITRRLAEEEMDPEIQRLRERITELETQISTLRQHAAASP
jgi:uncharacterized protein